MTTAHRPLAAPAAALNPPPPLLLVLAAVAVLAAVGCLTLGPPGAVADARRAVTAVLEVLAAPWSGSVHRAQVDVVANVLLFVPVGALAALVLRRRTAVLPLALGAGTSVLIELAQTALPGRVPDLADVAANVVGTALGVALTATILAPSRRTARRRRALRGRRRGALAALVAAPLVLAGATGCSVAAPVGPANAPAAATPVGTPSGQVELTSEHGWVPDDQELSPFDDVPALTRLDGALLAAVQDAHRDATADGLAFHVTAGWRSADYQQSLFDDAVAKYGSAEAARAWVLRPDESSHVTGDAVDIGPTDAMYWLARYGSDYGLCQTYGNEVWHFELTVEPGGECPAPLADPTAR